MLVFANWLGWNDFDNIANLAAIFRIMNSID
jgi:hypothetical protein